MSTFHIVWTIVLFTIFVGIVVWAWSGRKKRDFDEAARLPLTDDCPLDEANVSRRVNPEIDHA